MSCLMFGKQANKFFMIFEWHIYLSDYRKHLIVNLSVIESVIDSSRYSLLSEIDRITSFVHFETFLIRCMSHLSNRNRWKNKLHRFIYPTKSSLKQFPSSIITSLGNVVLSPKLILLIFVNFYFKSRCNTIFLKCSGRKYAAKVLRTSEIFSSEDI